MNRSVTVEADAREAIKTQLVAAAGRLATRRRQRRQIGVAAATISVLVCTAAGAATVTNLTTGVAPIDELLNNMPQPSGTSDVPSPGFGSGGVQEPRAGGMPGALPRDIRPGPGSASEPLEVRWGRGKGVAVAYLTRGGEVCSAMAGVGVDPGDKAPLGVAGGCFAPDVLTDLVARRGGVCCGMVGGVERRILDGYVDSDVVAIGFPTVAGRVDVRTTAPWALPGAAGESLRYFVAVLPDEEVAGARIPPVEVEFSDGRITRLEQ